VVFELTEDQMQIPVLTPTRLPVAKSKKIFAVFYEKCD
jgi:hypothetical protein